MKKILVMALIVIVLLPTVICHAMSMVTVKVTDMDFMRNLIADIDAITPIKELDDYDCKHDILLNSKLNTIYNRKYMNNSVTKPVLMEKCTALAVLRGPQLASQLSEVILDSIKVAFSKEFDPLGEGIKSGIKQAEISIPRSSFEIDYTYNSGKSIASMIDKLYEAQTKADIKEKYSYLVMFLGDIVNTLKSKKNIAVSNGAIALNKIAFGVTGIERNAVPRKISDTAINKKSADNNINRQTPAETVQLSTVTKIPVSEAKPVHYDVGNKQQNKNNKELPKIEKKSSRPADNKQTDNKLAPVKFIAKREYSDLQDCTQSHISSLIPLSAGYGALDLLKMAKYFCERIFLVTTDHLKSGAHYSGYGDCVEKNIGSGSDGFTMLRQSFVYCDADFGIKE